MHRAAGAVTFKLAKTKTNSSIWNLKPNNPEY